MFYSELLKFDQTLKGDETPSCSSIFIHPELSIILPYDESGSCETESKLTYLSIVNKTRQSNHCGFIIYFFDTSKSKSMVRLVRSEKMALSALVFARKIARMILIQNI